MTKRAQPHPPIVACKRSDLHLARKAWHIGMVMGMYLVYHYTSELTSFLCLLTGALLFIPVDFLRQNNLILNQFLVRWFRPIIRDHELHKLAGTTYLITGVFVIFLFFSRNIVELTLLFLAIGDPFASWCGIRFGRDKIFHHKSLQGSLGAFAVCTLLAGVYFYFNGLMVERLLVTSILAGFVAALCEVVPIGRLDDNLTFPLLCSSCLWILFYLFGGI
jgi:dolichol kinase